jgi:hypothetical protein
MATIFEETARPTFKVVINAGASPETKASADRIGDALRKLMPAAAVTINADPKPEGSR